MITRGSGEFDAPVTDVDGNEHDVVVSYKGYSDPGVFSGPVERCYPPEGEIELDIIGVEDFNISDPEHERLEEKAWEHLMSDNGRR